MPTKCPKCDSDNTSDSKFCKECETQLMPAKEVPEVTKTLETPVQELTRGTKFAGRYEIVEKLGTGGVGSVYRVEDNKIHEDVALKLIKPEIASDKKTIERFSNKLKLARKIRHNNVCQMFDLGEAEDIHFITMEYVSGEDLKSFILRSKQLSIPTAVSRKSIADKTGNAWLQDESLSVKQAIECYTLGFSYASFDEEIKGSLKEVKLADILVLSKDVFTIPEEEILKTDVVYTILGGKITYSSGAE